MGKKNYIYTIKEKCVGCEKCIIACPVPYANKLQTVRNKDIFVIDQDKCITCGFCIQKCPHDARDYIDDTDDFFDALAKGEKISMISAPATKFNYENYKKLCGFLKSYGVNFIYDVSFGAEIDVWAIVKAVKENKIDSVIAPPCPTIVDYIEKYKPEIIHKLGPLYSAVLSTVVYMKKYANITDKIAFLSPCISKSIEFDDPDTHNYVSYNVTYKKLNAYLANNNINLNDFNESDYDDIGAGLCFSFSKPGGLKDNIRFHLPESWIKQVEGFEHAFSYLDEYSQRVVLNKKLPLLVDILCCQNGCNLGTGTDNCQFIDDISCNMNEERKNKIEKSNLSITNYPLHEYFEKTININDFLRNYRDKSALLKIKEPTEKELGVIFNKMYKTTEASRNINCHACGYNSCKVFAQVVFNDYNKIGNCVYYTKKLLENETQTLNIKNAELAEKEIALLNQNVELKKAISELALSKIEQKSMLHELEKANLELHNANRQKDSFLSTMSHELRTPLNAVLGCSQLLKKKFYGDLTDKQYEYVNLISISGNYLLDIINNILDVAKINSGTFEIRLSEFEPQLCVNEILKLLNSQFEQKLITFETRCFDDLATVYADQQRVKQVLLNLISNAIKFTPNNGKIIIDIQTFETNYIKISVTDNGVGIEESDFKNIFQEFFQTKNTIDNVAGGTGIGLALSKKLVETMKGNIGFTSKINHGSTFWFTLPRNKYEKGLVISKLPI